ncbi:MAG: cytochrome b [Parvularculales bacterium]
MTIKNTKKNYGLISILLHWIVAFGFLGAYAAVYYRHWFSTGGFSMTELNSNMISLYLHLSFGITIAVFVVLRIIWRLMNKTPDDVSGGNKLEHLAAHGMHWTLYAVMIIMPVTGYMGTKLDTNFFFLFDIPKFNDTWLYPLIVEQWLETDWKSFESVMDAIHKNGGAYVVWVLIALHAGAALYHHFIRKDAVLKRMLTVDI